MTASSPAAGGAQRRLLSWVRDGVAARAGTADPGHGPLPARLSLTTGLTVNGVAVAGPTLTLHGPGDVTAVDPRQVVRTDPVPGSSSFEPDHLALVEFDDPGLPWRLTPAAPHPVHGLRPWLVLVVVDATVAGVSLTTGPGDRLPVLTAPLGELPDLAYSAAWAHAEVTMADGEDLATLLRDAPERSVSRLIAPRLLTAGGSYLACVVPAFEHGRLAGLGDPVTGDTTAPAWQGTTGTVRLPVYHHWSFTTGPDGDFGALARRLHGVLADPGLRLMSYKEADPELRAALGSDPGRLWLPPALTAPGTLLTGAPPDGYATAMGTILSRGATAVAPVVYLAAHTGGAPGWTGTEPLWMRQLNIDPRLRAAAGLGAEVVRVHQEALMASAWRQAAELDRVNRELANGRLGQTMGESLHQRFFDLGAGGTPLRAGGAADVILTRAATALRRLPGQGPSGTAAAVATTVFDDLAEHPPTAAAASTDFQRVTRPAGPVARAAGATTEQPLPSPVGPVATGTVVPAPPVRASADTGVFDRYSGTTVKYRQITLELVDAADRWWSGLGGAGQPAGAPGPLGYLADLVVVQQGPAPARQPSLALHRDVDFDAWPGRVGTPYPLPYEPPVADFRLMGVRLGRIGAGPEPSLVLLGVEHYTDSRTGYRRGRAWIRSIPAITSAGHGPAGPWIPIDDSLSHEAIAVADLTFWRDPDPCVVIAHSLGSGNGFELATARPDGTGAAPATGVAPEMSPGGAVDVAIDMVPIPARSGQPYTEPRDLLLCWIEDYVENEDVGYPIHYWRICWTLVKDFDRPNQTTTPVRDLRLWGEHDPEDPLHPQLSVSVTDIDGDGRPDVVLHFTDRVSVPGPGGWVMENRLHQIVGHGLHLDGRVSHWSQSRELPIVPGEPGQPVFAALGDVDNARLARLGRFGDRFAVAARAHQARLIRPATAAPSPPQPAPYEVESVADAVTGLLRPADTLPPRVLERIDSAGAPLPEDPAALTAAGDGGDAMADPLRPRRYEPAFPQPMSEPLRELFPELVFPAVDGMPADSVALMAGSPELIAAYLAGLNDAFGRELLWRGFPSSGRATWFRRFFDVRGAGSSYDGDIRDIADWGTGDLASVVSGPAASGGVILLIRAELLRRFPGAIVQAVQAQWTGRPLYRDPTDQVLAPSFIGRIGADTGMFAFPLSPAAARGAPAPPGSAGWFFVFAEPPTASRFAAAAEPSWDGSASHTAAALLRPPFRIAIHATDLLPAATLTDAPASTDAAPSEPGTTE
ncbi:hypothetical protein SAMN04489712_12144 [Thermomonospora echinospora]|uniref:Uncharacterized protein n=1 Tax=Thermomonospora echinospora TaxID=1992 RepID=A0A1H6DTM9_9ACTN|nr:hypothetical protein [Thermomonospora echinospora]SEG87955.1 hypothetical protein SAMN04489712_12144 [Thermomonospora echinospora]